MWLFWAFLLISSTGQGALASDDLCGCLDLVFVIDTSGSINETEWELLQDFLCDYINCFNKTQGDDIIFGVANFSRTAQAVFGWDDPVNAPENPDYSAVKAAIRNIVPQSRGTRHNRGLERALEIICGPGDRNDTECPDVVMMLSDGKNNSGGDAVGVANQIKLDKNATIISVAIGEDDLIAALLQDIASENPPGSPLYLEVANFESLSAIVGNLYFTTCTQTLPTTTTSTTTTTTTPPPTTTTTTTTPVPTTTTTTTPVPTTTTTTTPVPTTTTTTTAAPTPTPRVPMKTVPPRKPDPGCQTCCCGKLHGDRHCPIPDRKFRCCGQHFYDPKKDTCCAMTPNRGYKEKYSRCCGTVAFDPRYATCCNGLVVTASRTQDQCCGNTAFNQRNEICCGTTVHHRGSFSQCCGQQVFNARNNICCGGILSPGCSSELRCCGTVAFNPLDEMCCGNSLRPAPAQFAGQDIILDCFGTPYNPCLQTCCCNPTLHDTPVTPTTACCNWKIYDINNQLCCAGAIHNVDPKWFRCCGKDVYKPHLGTCCNGNLVNGVGLCCGNKAVFNPKKQLCCNGHVETGNPARTKCCNGHPYHIRRQLCCDGVVQRGGKGWRCCGQASFKTKFFNCCGGHVIHRDVFRQTCWCD